MTVAGEGRNPGQDQMLRIADAAGIEKRQARDVIGEVSDAVAEWSAFADAAGVDAKRSREIQKMLS
jgi:hypothetical protein